MSLTPKNWIAISAVSALGLAGLTGGAVATASTMPLVSGATNLQIPGLSVNDDGSVSTDDSGDLSFDVNSDSIV